MYFYLEYYISAAIVLFTFNPVCISGREHIPHDSTVIFVANHQSAVDIPMVGLVCGPRKHIWLALEYYIKAPVLGFLIRRMFVPVDSAVQTKAARSLMQVLRLLKTGKRDLIIFPEGGRYNDQYVHSFFRGFAVIAKDTKLPVIPIYMPNNGKIYPPNAFLFNCYRLEAYVGKPFYYKAEETEQEFTERVRDWFIKKADDLQ